MKRNMRAQRLGATRVSRGLQNIVLLSPRMHAESGAQQMDFACFGPDVPLPRRPRIEHPIRDLGR